MQVTRDQGAIWKQTLTKRRWSLAEIRKPANETRLMARTRDRLRSATMVELTEAMRFASGPVTSTMPAQAPKLPSAHP